MKATGIDNMILAATIAVIVFILLFMCCAASADGMVIYSRVVYCESEKNGECVRGTRLVITLDGFCGDWLCEGGRYDFNQDGIVNWIDYAEFTR